jgi:hypothetical protein
MGHVDGGSVRGSAGLWLHSWRVAALSALFVSCSGDDRAKPQESVGQVAQPVVSVSSFNFPTVGYTPNTELSVAYVPGAGPPGTSPAPGRWVAAVINTRGGLGTKWGWMYSTDGNGNSWTFENQRNYDDFGCAGGACPGTTNPGYATTDYFRGWNSDPSIAAVTDSSWGTGWDHTVVAVVGAKSQNRSVYGNCLVALSTDGGQTWGNGSQGSGVAGTIQWLGTNTTNGDGCDLGFVFSNPQSPYSTYASWRDGSNQGRLRKIQYDLTQSPPSAQFGSVIDIPKETSNTWNPNGDTNPNRFNFGFATLPSACTSGQEGIFVAWVANTPGSSSPNGAFACNNTGCGYQPSNPGDDRGRVYWNMAIYDTGANGGTGAWLSDGSGHHSFTFAQTDQLDGCVGWNPSPPTVSSCPSGQYACPTSGCPWYSNTVDPHIAVDPTTATVWISHTTQTSSSSPVSVEVDTGTLSCNGSNLNWPPISLHTWSPFSPPYSDDDQWLPAIAMHRNGSNQRVGVYWYGTNNSANSQTALFAGFLDGGSISGPTQLTSSTLYTSGTSWQVGVNGDLGAVDYQTLGTSWTNSSFLSVWSRDNRDVFSPLWNGGFETGGSGFNAYGPSGTNWVLGGNVTPVKSSSTVKTGSYSTYLGVSTGSCAGAGNGHESTISQTFKVPNDLGANLSMSFWYYMNCTDTVTYDWLTATLTPSGGSASNFFSGSGKICNPADNGTWKQSPSLPVTPGTTYTIAITNHDDDCAGDPSDSFIDDVGFSGPTTSQTIVTNLAQ